MEDTTPTAERVVQYIRDRVATDSELTHLFLAEARLLLAEIDRLRAENTRLLALDLTFEILSNQADTPTP